MSDLRKVYEEYSDQIEILAINITISDSYDEAMDVIEDMKLNYPVLLDVTGSVAQSYLVRNVPTNVFIGKDGKVASYYLGQVKYEDIRSEFDKLLAE